MKYFVNYMIQLCEVNNVIYLYHINKVAYFFPNCAH